MTFNQESGNVLHFSIGPLGKAFTAIVVVLFGGLMSWQALTIVDLSKQQAVMSFQFGQFTRELADTNNNLVRRNDQFVAMQRQLAEHEVRINNQKQLLDELQREMATWRTHR